MAKMENFQFLPLLSFLSSLKNRKIKLPPSRRALSLLRGTETRGRGNAKICGVFMEPRIGQFQLAAN